MFFLWKNLLAKMPVKVLELYEVNSSNYKTNNEIIDKLRVSM
jgi:hypothetical protein